MLDPWTKIASAGWRLVVKHSHLFLAAGLQVLELGSNRIRAIECLDTLGLLRELWLGRNRITEISNLFRCVVCVHITCANVSRSLTLGGNYVF